MRPSLICAAAAAVLLLSGCRVGPNYQRPGVTVPPEFRNQKVAEQASLADMPWWEVFKDPRLQELIQTSLTNNYDLRTAVTRIDQAREIVAQARSEYFPSVNYGIEGGANKPAFAGLQFAIPARTYMRGVLAMSWEADVWGRIRRSNEAALAQMLGQEEARRAVLLSLVSQVAQAYYGLLGLDLQLEIARKNRDAFHKSFEIFDQRFQAGVVSRLETARAEAALATVAAAIPELEREIVIQENLIHTLLGQNPAPVPRSTKLLEQQMPPEIPAGLPSTLLERRPDIRQAEAAIRQANAQIGIATANFFPRLGLTALFGRLSSPLEDIVLGSGTNYNALITIAGPIFQGGSLRAAKRQAVAQWRETQLTYQKTALTAFREVANALISREKLELVRQEQERAVAAYEVSVDVATQRYLAGLASYLDVLTAQQELFPAETSLAQTQIQQRLIIVQLYMALGGGWNIQDPNWTNPASISAQPAAAPAKP